MNRLPSNGSRTAGDTVENIIYAGRCKVYGVYPELTTTGTVTFRDSATAVAATARHVCASGLTQAGKTFGPEGVLFNSGLTVQLSVGTDLSLIVWEPV